LLYSYATEVTLKSDPINLRTVPCILASVALLSASSGIMLILPA